MQDEAKLSFPSFDPIAKTLHWLTALAVFVMLAIGWTMTDLPAGALRTSLFMWHKSIGITILVITLFRLYWRAQHPPPPLPENMPKWQRFVAVWAHRSLYTLLILLPITGWMIVSAHGGKIVLFNLVPLPDLPFLHGLPDHAAVTDIIEGTHGTLASIMAILVTLHIGAALKHHFFDKDNVLLTMMPKALIPFLRKIRRG